MNDRNLSFHNFSSFARVLFEAILIFFVKGATHATQATEIGERVANHSSLLRSGAKTEASDVSN